MTHSPGQTDRLAAIIRTLGEAYLARGQYAEAVKKLGQLAKAGSRLPEDYRNLAVAYLGLNEYSDEARQAFQRALELLPQDDELLVNICRGLLNHQALDEFAIRCYNRALDLPVPFKKEIHQTVVLYYQNQGRPQEAFEALKQVVLAETGNDANALRQLVELGWQIPWKNDLGEFLAALADQSDKDAEIHRYRALDCAYRILSQVPDAIGATEYRGLLADALSKYATLRTVGEVVEFCALRLALSKLEWLAPAISAQARNAGEAALVESPEGTRLEAVGAGAIATSPAADLHALLLPRIRPVATDSDQAGEVCAEPPGDARSLLVLKILNPDRLAARLGESVATKLGSRFLNFCSRHLIKVAEARCYQLADGLIAVSESMTVLTTAAVDLLHQIEQYNASAKESNRIQIQAVVNGDSQNNHDFGAGDLETLHEALQVLAANVAEGLEAQGSGSRLLFPAGAYEAGLISEEVAAKFLGEVQPLAPGPGIGVYEAVWRNPLDHVDEEHPFPFGRYSITTKLQGHARYGTYRGRDRQLERAVIVKALSPQTSLLYEQNPSLGREVVNAIRRIGQLDFPGLAAIYDMGYQEGLFFYAREYIEGESLEQLLQSDKRPSPTECLVLAATACRILSEVHNRRVFHGNLKPSNIWLLANGDVKLTDFHISAFTNTVAAAGSPPTGTWQYCAPEFLRTGQPTVHSDIYSLGLILYELLDGEPPGVELAHVDEASQLLEIEIPPLAPQQLDVPDDCAMAIARATHPDSSKRFGSVLEFEEALLASLESLNQE